MKKKKTAAIFFNIEKVYEKINNNKTFKQIESMGKCGQMMKFIRELISKRWIKVGVSGSTSQNTDPKIPQREYQV